jgi:hypothetical protein
MGVSCLRRVALLSAISASLPLSQALACPEFVGTFECPAIDKQPPLTLIVNTRATVEDGAVYIFTYRIMGRDLPDEYEVNPKRQRKPGDSNSCEGNVLIHNEWNGEVVRMSIDSRGNFERVRNGKPEMVCLKKVD